MRLSKHVTFAEDAGSDRGGVYPGVEFGMRGGQKCLFQRTPVAIESAGPGYHELFGTRCVDTDW